MASLERLSIMGIRSFGTAPEDKQAITFQKPLTLILGDNGCGKSTIIECLRYITAQKDSPGKTFIHDPNLTASTTVKASVKLKITDAKGEEVHLTKIVEASRSRKAITTKTLDSTITFKDPVTKQTTNTSIRAADFTPKVFSILGVSKPILENVIFCTQEDAHWPLDTDQKLKEKFDQIFDSDKYNKCLKKVRDMRKSLVTDKKKRETELKYLKENKTSAVSKRKELQNLENDVEAIGAELKALDESLVPIREKLERLTEQEKEVSHIYTARETTKAELNGVEKLVEELRAKIVKARCEFNGTDSELDNALLACDMQSRNADQLKSDLQKYQKDEQRLTSEVSRDIGRVGQLTNLAEMNQNKIEEKMNKMRLLADQLEMKSSHLSEDGLDRRISGKKSEVTNLLQEHEAEENDLQVKVNKARDDVINKECSLKNEEATLNGYERESLDLRKQLERYQETMKRKEKVSEELLKAERALKQHIDSLNAVQKSDQLQLYQKELKETEMQLIDLEAKLKSLQGHAETSNKLKLLEEQLENKNKQINLLFNMHSETLADILGKTPDSYFKRAVEDKSNQLSRNLKEWRSKKTALEAKVSQYKHQGNTLSTSLQKANSELQQFHDQVDELTSGENLNETIERISGIVKDLQDERGTLKASEYMFTKYISKLTKPKPCCPLCKRDFAAQQESTFLIDHLNSQIRNIPSDLEGIQSKLADHESQLDKLRPLKSQQEKMEALRVTEIPKLMKDIEANKALATQTRKELEDVDKQIICAEKALGRCSSMIGDMALLDQTSADRDKIKTESDRLQKMLPRDWTMTEIEDVENQKAEMAKKRKKTHDDKENIQSQLTAYNEKLSRLQSQKHALAEEELQLRGSFGQRQQQEERLLQLKDLLLKQKSNLEQARNAIAPLKEVHVKFTSEFQIMKESHKNILKEKQAELDGLTQQLKEIRRLQKEISDYKDKGEENVLVELKSKIKEKEERIKHFKVQIDSVNTKLGDFSKTLVRRRELEDNKAWREKKQEVTAIKEKLSDLETKFNSMGHNSILKEKKKLRMDEEKIGQRKATISGKRGALDGQVQVLKKELNSSMYRDIDLKFKQELIEMHISDGIAADLLRYVNAMDFAMGLYHEQQMKRVNSFVREYWRKIYRGNDIDYIEIYTEKAEVAETRRTFNYRLVQVKAGTSLDMRNRCSAGQKMLASLIIRMALAEVFSNNCGILTLDEPTTNLDRKNIRNLANTLNELIATKQSLTRTNFQLIVITHDKEFLNELISVNAVDTYVQVSRNREGKSQLTVCSV